MPINSTPIEETDYPIHDRIKQIKEDIAKCDPQKLASIKEEFTPLFNDLYCDPYEQLIKTYNILYNEVSNTTSEYQTRGILILELFRMCYINQLKNNSKASRCNTKTREKTNKAFLDLMKNYAQNLDPEENGSDETCESNESDETIFQDHTL